MPKRNTEQEELHRLFHAAWGQAIDSPSYDKEVWKGLDRILGRIVQPDQPLVTPLDDPMERWKGFPIGHWIALVAAWQHNRPLPEDSVRAVEAWRDAKLTAKGAAAARALR